MADRDYYGMLGVSRDATGEEIKRAYRKLARELHPDVNPDPAAQERFKEVTAVYEVLSDPERRRIVDLGGDPLAPGGGGGGRRRRQPVRRFRLVRRRLRGVLPRSGGSRGPRSRVRQGADALLRIELTLPETAFGVRREVTRRHGGRLHDLRRQRLRAGHLPAHLPDLRRQRRDPVDAALAARARS